MAATTVIATIFRHSPLLDPSTQTRLLWMHSATTFSISTWDRKIAPGYYAISFTWGQPEPTCQVQIDDKLFTIRPNCQYALEQVHAYVGSVYIWIDSICIDQVNNIEKSSQVAIMGSIYQQATGVLACIGPPDDTSEYISSAVKDLKDMGLLAHKPVFPNVKDDAWFELLRLQLHDFFKRPYFERLWVLQEVCAGGDATTFLCGASAISRPDLMAAISLIAKTKAGITYAVSTIRDTYSLSPTKKLSFPKDLELFMGLKCEDPRDRVYGTLMLFDWNASCSAPPRPDYSVNSADLCLQIVKDLEDRSLGHLRIVVSLLGIAISSPCPGEMVSWYWPNETLERNTIPIDAGNFIASSTNSSWRTCVYSGCRLTTDASGKLQAASYRDLCNPSKSVLSEGSLQERISSTGCFIYTGSKFSVFTNSYVLSGDILVECHDFSCILRPTSDNRNFVYIGRAIHTNNHIRYPLSEHFYVRRDAGVNQTQLHIQFEASDEEGMALAVTGAEISEQDLSSLDSLPFDIWSALLNMRTPRIGAIVRDVTYIQRGHRGSHQDCRGDDCPKCEDIIRSPLLSSIDHDRI